MQIKISLLMCSGHKEELVATLSTPASACPNEVPLPFHPHAATSSQLHLVRSFSFLSSKLHVLVFQYLLVCIWALQFVQTNLPQNADCCLEKVHWWKAEENKYFQCFTQNICFFNKSKAILLSFLQQCHVQTYIQGSILNPQILSIVLMSFQAVVMLVFYLTPLFRNHTQDYISRFLWLTRFM